MSLAEVIEAVKRLPREEQLQVKRMIDADLTEADKLLESMEGKVFAIWSPYDEYAAAAVLRKMLEEGEPS